MNVSVEYQSLSMYIVDNR